MRDDECEDRRSGYIIIQTIHGQGLYYNTDNVCTGVEPNNYKLEVVSGNGAIYFSYSIFEKSLLSKKNLKLRIFIASWSFPWVSWGSHFYE